MAPFFSYPGSPALSTGPADSAQTIGRYLAQEEGTKNGYYHVYGTGSLWPDS